MASVLVLLLVGLVPCSEPAEVTTPTPALRRMPRARTITRRKAARQFMKATTELELWNDQPLNRPGLRRRWILEGLGQ